MPEAGREMAVRTRASRCHQPGDRGNGEQDQPLTATVTATAANRCHQRPATAHNSCTIRANGGYADLKSERSFDSARSAAMTATAHGHTVMRRSLGGDED